MSYNTYAGVQVQIHIYESVYPLKKTDTYQLC